MQGQTMEATRQFLVLVSIACARKLTTAGVIDSMGSLVEWSWSCHLLFPSREVGSTELTAVCPSTYSAEYDTAHFISGSLQWCMATTFQPRSL
mmetsp:Transcript_11050/g.15941  ORF Transcript_11050/g.15941 Transcript_11050/m.15941 type:complete len:93 (-) Transcript_11050:159-437(-)